MKWRSKDHPLSGREREEKENVKEGKGMKIPWEW